jgi:hypothetical protein
VCVPGNREVPTQRGMISVVSYQKLYNTDARNRIGSGQADRHIQTDNSVSKEELWDSEHYRGDTL